MADCLIEELENYRKERGLTYARLAQRLEVPETYLYRWRRKKNINGIYAKFIRVFLANEKTAVTR